MRGVSKTRKCPDRKLIQDYLLRNCEFNSMIDVDDKICLSCYKSHLVIVNQVQQHPVSNDSDLQHTLDKIRQQTSNPSQITTVDEAIAHAAHYTALVVGEALLNQTAMLLPTVYKQFMHRLEYILHSNKSSQGTETQTLTTPQWLHSQLSALLDYHLAIKCSIKKFGTVLYRYQGDLLHALNVALAIKETGKCHLEGWSKHKMTTLFQNR